MILAVYDLWGFVSEYQEELRQGLVNTLKVSALGILGAFVAIGGSELAGSARASERAGREGSCEEQVGTSPRGRVSDPLRR